MLKLIERNGSFNNISNKRQGVSSLSVWARGERAEGDAGAEAEARRGAREAAGGGVNARP